jgi:hypothetical protein
MSPNGLARGLLLKLQYSATILHDGLPAGYRLTKWSYHGVFLLDGSS